IILTTSVALTGISNSSRPITKKVSPAHIPIERPVETKPVPQKVPGSVVSFLSQYNLEGYARQFWKALQFNNLLPLQQEISRDRGLEMISLPQIPNGLNGLDALRVNGQTDGGSHYIYFWKPSLKIKQFHRDVRGQEIVQLQHLLAGEYYAGAIDGIVGPMLAQSITDFQTDMRLPISGVPDSQTLFLLYALKQKQERSK
ncbi:MAG: peptidoglycan-binding domain-containing protein, partial [candidate division Zixibacteria bacterium]|nr:peptidoglycan-binding domain-containing protein [candidate division Zixibacteria bacterium]